jgi:1-acyl-sn-glycerol-3-phosphate acyltransferase
MTESNTARAVFDAAGVSSLEQATAVVTIASSTAPRATMWVMAVSRSRRQLLGNPVARTLLSLWAWFVLGIVVIIWVPLVALVWVVTVPFDKGRYWPGWLFRKLCVVHNWFNPLWRFRTSGVTIDDPRHPYVVVSNHESFVDMLLISHLPWEMKWLSKESMFKIPLVGWLMSMAGDIRLIRGNKQSIVSAMHGCSDRLGKRTSVMLFPEGTRTRDGSLGEFKDGAFRIAIEHQVPIVPMAVTGTFQALQAGSWKMNVTDAEVRVLEPVPTEGLTKDDVPELRDRVRALIAGELETMRS